MKKDFTTLLLEKIPGAISWIIILSPLWAAWLIPSEYGIFLLSFIVFLVIKSLKNLIYFIINYSRIYDDGKVDWVVRNRNLINYDKVIHIVIVPFAKEGYDVLYSTVKALSEQIVDKERIILCLTSEAKFPEGDQISLRLKEEFGQNFFHVWNTVHTLKVGEVVGKSANMLNGAHYVQNKIQELGLNEDYITLTSCDCDSLFPNHYFSMLTNKFLASDDRYTIFWAGALAFIENFWKLPYFSRVLASHFTYNNVSILGREWFRFVQISTYSASYRLFKSIGFYSPDVIPEDFHTFFKALYLNGIATRCAPMYLLINSDAAEGRGYVDTFVNQYKQVQRWAYGVSDFPFIFKNTVNYLKNRNYSLRSKLYVFSRSFSVALDHQLWPTYGILLGIGFTFVFIFNPDLTRDAFWWRLPAVTSILWTIASVYYVSAFLISFNIRPRLTDKPFRKYWKWYLYDVIAEIINWVLFPFIAFFLAVLPAIDAHTRLMFGKYLEYWITEKK